MHGLEDKGLKPTTIRSIHTMLKGDLTYAVKHRLINENRATLVDLPK